MRSARDLRWAVVILLAATTLRLLALGELALHGDEAYYYLWSQNLDWSYYDHPAGVALLVFASTAVAGASEFGIRWLNAVVGILGVAATLWLGREVFGRRASLVAGGLVATGAPYVITSRIVYTDALHILLALLAVGAYWRLLRRGGRSWRAGTLAGLSLAMLVNTKYTAYLIVGTLGLVTVLWHREVLRRPAVWVAAAIGVLGLLPVVGWNIAHDFASFRWQLGHLASPSPGAIAQPILLAWAQNLYHALRYVTWPIAVLACLGLGHLAPPGRRLLTCVSLVATLPVMASPANSPRNLSTGLVFLLLLSAELVASWVRSATHNFAIRRLSLGVGLLLVAAYGLGSAWGLQSGLAWIPKSSGVAVIRRDAAGWRNAAEAIAPADRDAQTAFVTVDYNLAGQLAYYTGAAVTTSWPQYRLWRTPSIGSVTAVAADYLPTARITTPLRDAYEMVDGPRLVVVRDNVGERRLWLWRLDGLQTNPEAFLATIDYLALADGGQ